MKFDIRKQERWCKKRKFPKPEARQFISDKYFWYNKIIGVDGFLFQITCMYWETNFKPQDFVMIEMVHDNILYYGFLDKHDVSETTIRTYARQLIQLIRITK